MTLTTEKKKEVIEKYKTSNDDTGSANVQVALLSEKIDSLSNHFKSHKKDNHSRRGLLMMVNNCLLYTSPSPRDKRQSRMPSSA